jgi:16S rRNA (uracil1498-N3)-methyltransferase
MLKGRKFEWVLQKGTEMGVVEFVPVVTDRCVVANLDTPSKPKVGRWKRIILEAAEQSERGRLPRLHTSLLFPQACERARRSDLALLFWEGERITSLRSMLAQDSDKRAPRVQGQTTFIRRPFSISIFVGPEGGFSPREVDQARRYGIAPVGLGPRVLRAETAALVGTAIVLHHLEDI